MYGKKRLGSQKIANFIQLRTFWVLMRFSPDVRATFLALVFSNTSGCILRVRFF